jgi:hypothetical protein
MPKKQKSKRSVRQNPRKTRKAAPKSTPKVADLIPAVTVEQEKAARTRFIEGLIERREAVPQGQPLTPGATHEIVGTDAEGKPIVKRKRFSMF